MHETLTCTVPLPPEAGSACGVLRAMEHAAREHTTALGIGRDRMLAGYGAVWMIARSWLRLDAPPDPALPLGVCTWHRGVTRGLIYRDFDLLQRGERLGEAVQTWVLVDAERRTLLRMEQVAELRDTPRPAEVKAVRPRRLMPPPLAPRGTVCAGPDALDENGHINNTSYLPLVLDALGASARPICTLELCYHHECFAGQALPLLASERDGSLFAQLQTPGAIPAFDLRAEFA